MASNDTKWHIGIDIGTTNSSVCFTSYNPGRRQFDDPDPVKFDGDKALRSALLLDEAGTSVVQVGRSVYDHPDAAEFPERVRTEFKLRFGISDDARKCTCLLVTTLFAGLKRILPDAITPHNSVTNVGAPAEWLNQHPERILLLKQVVGEVGFPNVEVVAEPVAAMLYHAYLGQLPFESQPQNWLIVDVGGGTTDLAFVRTQPGGEHPKVIHTSGYDLGGKDFDRVLLEKVLLDRFWKGNPPNPSQRMDLLKASQKFKEGFSLALEKGEVEYSESFRSIRGLSSPVTISWQEFSSPSVAGGLVERFGQIIETGLENFDYGAGSITKVILTGGSARWPFVRYQLEFLRSADNVLRSLDPDLTIAKGLSLARTQFKPPTTVAEEPRRSWADELSVSSSRIIAMAKESASTQKAENLLDRINLKELEAAFEKDQETCQVQARERTLWFAGGGAFGSAAVAQVPGVASAGLPVLETKLITDIARIYGYSLEMEQALSVGSGMIVSGMVVKMGVLEIVGMIPGFGNVIKGGVAAAFIIGLGQAAARFFEKRRFG